eukprot:XP_016658483.1 PREDICTED: uncharacterized protein LOC100572889 isoform X2 [Acyrthosiphon pisum]
MNFEKFICLNNILSLDKLFCQFVDELDSWWLDVTDLSYEPTRIHSSTNKHTIIIDDEEVVQFSIPASNNWNDALILACLINMETKRTLSNIFDHITILMCVLKFNFIDKKSLKKKLKELVIKNYLIILFDNTHKIYNLNIEHIWNEINKNIHTNKYVNEILAIRRDTYYTTAVFYDLPSIFNPKPKINIQNQINKNNIFNSFQKKIIFIQQFIDSILTTHFTQITTNNIEENYVNEVKHYKNNLKNLLQVLPKKKNITSHTTEEILELIKNNQIIESIHYRPPQTPILQSYYSSLTVGPVGFHLVAAEIARLSSLTVGPVGYDVVAAVIARLSITPSQKLQFSYHLYK